MKLKRLREYRLDAPRGDDLLVVRTASLDPRDVTALGAQMRKAHPNWSGMLIVVDLDSRVDRLPEAMAKKLYEALKSRFEPPTQTATV